MRSHLITLLLLPKFDVKLMNPTVHLHRRKLCQGILRFISYWWYNWHLKIGYVWIINMTLILCHLHPHSHIVENLLTQVFVFSLCWNRWKHALETWIPKKIFFFHLGDSFVNFPCEIQDFPGLNLELRY